MSSRFRVLLPFLGTLALLSCAGPAELAQQSNEALAKGDLRKAYDRALRAIEKDPLNAQARAAYTQASGYIAADYRARVRALAAADSLAAADLVLEFRSFRHTVAEHGSPLAPDDAYEDDEMRIATAAAREYYRRGRAAMAERRPKQAWRDYGSCLSYVADYSDAAKRQQDAWRAARTRVALLPFADGIQVRGLSQEIADQCATEVPRHAGSSFSFTEFVPSGEVAGAITLAQAGRMSAQDAIAIGRKLGADCVVTGRFAGLRSSDDFEDLTMPVYRRVERQDDKGVTSVSWDEASLRVVTREREVTVNWDFEVIDVRSGAVLARHEAPANAAARIVWTDFKPEGDLDHYTLLPPDVRKSDSARAKRVDSQWEEGVGSWKLPELLRKSRDERGRSRWSKAYRREFQGVDSRRRPVWLGELPGEDDLAFIALAEAWRPVLDVLQELDARE